MNDDTTQKPAGDDVTQNPPADQTTEEPMKAPGEETAGQAMPPTGDAGADTTPTA